jgi:four helix bundle protein
MKGKDLKERTFQLALRIHRMAETAPKTFMVQDIIKQIGRSGTAAAANYSSACRPKSPKDFVNKLKIVEEELDETLFWLEFLSEAGYFRPERLRPLMDETTELLRIISKSLTTVRENQRLKRESRKQTQP